jgi:hypothetical protein
MKKHMISRIASELKAHYAAIAVLQLAIVLAALSPAQAQTGFYTLNGGTADQTGQTFGATLTNQSAVYVLNSGKLTMSNCTITKTGDATSTDSASQYGTNAGVLVKSAGSVTMTGGTVTTNAKGANGLFATGTNSAITMNGGSINASGGNAHGVDVTYGGSITLVNVDVTSNGASSSTLATDFGGGTVTVTGGTIIAASTESSSHSAGIYSTGVITVNDASVSSLGDNGGVIDGANSIILNNTILSGAKNGVKLWKTAKMNGSATVTLTGGSITASGGDAFYITGETGNAASANITLKDGAVVSASSGRIMNVYKSSTGTLVADYEPSLTGDMYSDSTSTLSVTLKNSTMLTGSAQRTAMTIDASSTWTVTANSTVTTITLDESKISGLNVLDIVGNGYIVHYDSTLAGNTYLNAQTYNLVNGGILTPDNITTAVENTSGVPVKYLLHQNYPNPFNPSTTIVYDLPLRSHVRITVHNLQGRELLMLVDSEIDAGTHSVALNAAALPSGMYFYRLAAGGSVLTRKMIMNK